MTTSAQDQVNAGVGSLRTWLTVGGIVAIITGLLIVLWPGITAQVVTLILAIYAIIGGILYLGAGLFGSMGGWARVGHVLAGIVFIVAGIMAFMNPATSAAVLAIIVVTFIGIAWIFEGFASLSTLGLSASKGWSVFYAIVSILGGIALLFAPTLGAAVLITWIGITLIVLGIVGIGRAISLGRA